ncbi:hypothetical protein [Bacillus sp. MZGC1]|uniref:hypothetical protein n=1 Tax=Bacillus sp. MZGC1 TaxID=2108543 RepID=UPI000D039536|nr:hypothetical protein [Bacillus sp. MZGC1]PRS47516.1 hypothetical protein C6Y06_18365 [Bacillus sp. MZGC1]
MRYTLYRNAVDSLAATYVSLEKGNELAGGEGAEHHIKDAILSINHATELLFKYLLKEQNEYLIFKDLDAYMKAKKKMTDENKDNIFEASPNIQTVGYSESIDRLELLCEMKIPDELKKETKYLNNKRNQIMHYEIHMSLQETEKLIKRIAKCCELLENFFSNHKEFFKESVGIARAEFTKDDLFGDLNVEVEDSNNNSPEDVHPGKTE